MNDQISDNSLKTPIFPTWCPGCGDFGIWGSLKNALIQLEYPHEKIVIVYGVGCSGNMADFIRSYGFHALHGRALPVAEGIKLANHGLKVIVVAGDGDTYGEGMGHFIAAMRGNHDLTLIVHNNEVYGLTTGQASPTTEKGRKTKSTPGGQIEAPVNPLGLAVVSGASWIGRGFAGNIPLTTQLIKQAIGHEGFSLLDIFQPCVTFNKVNTHLWYNQRIRILDADSQARDREQAFKLSQESDKLPLGIFFEDNSTPPYHEQVEALHEKPLVEQSIERISLQKILERFI